MRVSADEHFFILTFHVSRKADGTKLMSQISLEWQNQNKIDEDNLSNFPDDCGEQCLNVTPIFHYTPMINRLTSRLILFTTGAASGKTQRKPFLQV